MFKLSQRGGLYAALRTRGYTIEDTTVGNQPIIRIVSPVGRTWISSKKMAYPMNNHYVHQVADNKQMSYELAERLGLHIPCTTYANRETSLDRARELVSEYQKVIVKPLDSYKSHGVTVGVDSEKLLTEALEHAYKFSPTAIIQEQVQGEEYRFTVLEGKVISVLRRERPQVKGDGVSTVHELVRRENDLRSAISNTRVTYPQWSEELLGTVMNSDRVLGNGEVCILSMATLVSQGASVYELMSRVDHSYKRAAELFAATLGAGLLAVDMFILDEEAPATKGNYWFNEANASPSLKMYSTPVNADSRWVADAIVETTDRYLNNNI